MMKKWHFTLKNGAFYPRIQSILAFFLSVFWENKIILFCVRRREHDLWEKKLCENIRWVCVSLPARAFRTRGTSGTRPPTSCRAFLLRTLPPPPKRNSRQNTNDDMKCKTFHISSASLEFLLSGVCECPSESSPALHEVGAAHPPPSPPSPPKGPKVVKNSKKYKFYKLRGGGGA
jgi:hypothetical protein